MRMLRIALALLMNGFRKCREAQYCDEADPLLITESIHGRIEGWGGLIKSSVLRIAPVLTYGDFKRLLRFIEDSGLTIEAVKGAGNEVEVFVSSEALNQLVDAVAQFARSLVDARVFDAVRVAVNAMLGDGYVHWELIIQECRSEPTELIEAVEDGIEATLTLVNSLDLKSIPSSRELNPAVNVVRLECGHARALCIGLRVDITQAHRSK